MTLTRSVYVLDTRVELFQGLGKEVCSSYSQSKIRKFLPQFLDFEPFYVPHALYKDYCLALLD